jgi:membrane fusion protein (multidrug efflux system)
MTDTMLARAPAAAPAQPGARLRRRRLTGAVLGLLAATGVAWYGDHWWTVGRWQQSTDDAYVGGDVTAIAPKVSGLIAAVMAADNEPVRAGDLLVKLDDRDYRAALAKATAAVRAQQASLANLEATRRLREAELAAAAAGVTAADAEAARARDDDSRYRKLAALSVASVQSFQKADAGYKEAQAAAQKARAEVEAARRELEVIDTEKQQTAAALGEAEAERDLAVLNLGYTELRAPIDGVVGNRSARPGAYAQVGGQLLSLVPLHGLWVEANFKESQLAGMRAGEPATVAADALPGEVFHGRVLSLAPATGAEFSILPPENATGNFTKIVQRVPVRIALDGDAASLGRLRPGLSVTVTVDQRDADAGRP